MEWISGPRPSGLRSGCALPTPGRTRPAPAEALRCPESPDNLHTEGTTAVPGPDPRCPGAADHAFRPFPPLGLRPRCGNGRCCTSEWKWGPDCMGHRVCTGPSCQLDRQCNRQLRVEKRQRRFQFGVPDAEFHPLFHMCDHGRAFGFSPGSGRGRNGNQPGKAVSGFDLRRNLLEFKCPEVMGIACSQANGFAPVHRAASADCNDRVVPTGAEGPASRTDLIMAGVRRNIRKDFGRNPCLGQKHLQFGNERQGTTAPVGHDKRVGKPQSRASLADFGKPTRPIGDRHRKRPVLRLQNCGTGRAMQPALHHPVIGRRGIARSTPRTIFFSRSKNGTSTIWPSCTLPSGRRMDSVRPPQSPGGLKTT